MNEKQLRALLRKEIKTQLNEVGETDFLDKIGSSIRGKLGAGKTQLNLGLSKIDPKQIGKMTPEQKADLVANLTKELGLTSADYNIIKTRVARKLGAAEKAATSESIIKEEDDLGKLVGLSTAKVGGQSAIKYASKLLNAMKTLEGADKAKALGWVLAQIGVRPEELPSMVSRLKMQTKRQATGIASESTQVNEYVDDYLSMGETIAAVLTVLGGAGLLAWNEVKKAKMAVEKELDVKVSDDEMKSAEEKVNESKQRKLGKK